MIDNKSDRFHLDPGKVRKVELCHQPPGRHERVRATIRYVSGEVRVLTAHKSLLGTVLEDLYAGESQPLRRDTNFREFLFHALG
jgi:hypothetical protein